MDGDLQTFDVAYLEHVAQRLLDIADDPVLAGVIGPNAMRVVRDALSQIAHRMRDGSRRMLAKRDAVVALERAHSRFDFATDSARFALQNPDAAAGLRVVMQPALDFEVEDLALAAVAVAQ